jgi:phosphohistidine swiveling domain-containing protein
MFYSKAQTLNFIKNSNIKFNVLDLFYFKAVEFQSMPEKILESIKRTYFDKYIIVRSSSADEDGHSNSLAGEYDSVLNVPSGNREKITKAINTVIASYEKKRPLLSNDEIIIQNMVENTTMSGVIFTHDLNTGAPYYVINYDDQSGLTNTVTSGIGEYANRTLYIHRNSINKLRSERFKKLLLAVQELEQVMKSQFLDIEFALGKDLTPYLLQVRSITTQPNWNHTITKRIDATLLGVQLLIAERFKKIIGIYGETTVFGQMSDWNPIEMIGRAPRALAASLYQTFITDNAWRSARLIMGYAVPTGQPLMLILAGQPFIDTRLSFHSYIPEAVSSSVAEKLVNHWIDRLKVSPELHDKVEFEVAITTYSFDFNQKIEQLIGNVLTISEKKEFKQAHLKQTKSLIKGKSEGSIYHALKKIDILSKKQAKKINFDSSNNLAYLFTMVDDCINLGTIPFSILARHGFIAKTILISLNRRGVITLDEVNQIQASVHTIASELVNDMHSLQVGILSNGNFIKKYGHLRPGTYDITSQRYDQMDSLSSGSTPQLKEKNSAVFEFSSKQKQQVDNFLVEDGFVDFNAEDLLNYIRESIVGREYGKFIFARSVSDALELIARFAENHGLSREEISHVPIDNLLNTVKTSNEVNIEDQLRKISKYESEKHDISVTIRLPQLLIDQEGVHIIPFQISHPNFITHKKVIAQCVMIYSNFDKISLKEKVVMIERADPGFDWIFSQNIVGLITKYGGVNSHMAIRCAEFGIPAAIGCGEQLFSLLIKSNKVHIDCAAGLVNPLH